MKVGLSSDFNNFGDEHRALINKACELATYEIILCICGETIKKPKEKDKPIDSFFIRLINVLTFIPKKEISVTICAFSTEEELKKHYEKYEVDIVL